MRNSSSKVGARGFSLIELMIAASMSLFVVAGALIWVTRAAEASSTQARATQLASQGRLVLDLIGRDVRSAGDSVQLLPSRCLGAAGSPGAPFGCAAILEPHPWRITIARNAWGAGADALAETADDLLPTAEFANNPRNVVTYQFVPRGDLEDLGGSRKGYVGRIERIVNPFGFGGEAPQRTVLLDRVVADNQMRPNAAGDASDPRTDYAVFRYRILSVNSGEYAGDVGFTQRATRTGSFLLPPVRLFAFPSDPVAWAAGMATAAPYLPAGYTAAIVGLDQDATARTTLRPGGTGFADDLRYVLDFNRIRAVDVAFKVAEARDDVSFTGGVDLDADRPGTARVASMDNTFELKAFTSYLE